LHQHFRCQAGKQEYFPISSSSAQFLRVSAASGTPPKREMTISATSFGRNCGQPYGDKCFYVFVHGSLAAAYLPREY